MLGRTPETASAAASSSTSPQWDHRQSCRHDPGGPRLRCRGHASQPSASRKRTSSVAPPGAEGGTGSRPAASACRAIADNRRLWLTVNDLMRDPLNALPQDLRASIVSVGLAAQREMDRDSPDFDFLISINENIAAGLPRSGADATAAPRRPSWASRWSYLTSLYGTADSSTGLRQPAVRRSTALPAVPELARPEPRHRAAVGGAEPDAGHQGDRSAACGEACRQCLHRRESTARRP